MARVVRPDLDPRSADAARLFGPSILVTDCKALFDAAHSSSSGLGLSEKRTAIELKMIVERLEFLGAHWRWANSDQQMADGTTKVTAR